MFLQFCVTISAGHALSGASRQLPQRGSHWRAGQVCALSPCGSRTAGPCSHGQSATDRESGAQQAVQERALLIQHSQNRPANASPSGRGGRVQRGRSRKTLRTLSVTCGDSSPKGRAKGLHPAAWYVGIRNGAYLCRYAPLTVFADLFTGSGRTSGQTGC